MSCLKNYAKIVLFYNIWPIYGPCRNEKEFMVVVEIGTYIIIFVERCLLGYKHLCSVGGVVYTNPRENKVGRFN